MKKHSIGYTIDTMPNISIETFFLYKIIIKVTVMYQGVTA